MSKENSSKLRYSDYWDRDPLTWNVNNWDVYFIGKQPHLATSHSSHLALSEEIRFLKKIHADTEHPANKASQRLQNELKDISKNNENKKIWNASDRIASLRVESELIDLESNINEKKGRQAGLQIARRGFQVYADTEFDSVERERRRNENNEVAASPVTTHPYFHVHIPPPRVVTLPPQRDSYTQAQRLQASEYKIHPSNASTSPRIEAETDIFNYENDDDSETSDLNTPNHEMLEEAIDDQEEVKEATNNKVEVAKENKKGPFRLSETNRKEIDTVYNLMDKQYMWKLSSGRFVEEELYKLGQELEFEHAVHSFILDVDDDLVAELFTEKELREIESTPFPEVPELSEEVENFLEKFIDKTNLKEIRQILKEESFGNNYDCEKHHDIDYICLALHALVREIESGKLMGTMYLENWFNCHVWNMVFDQAFGDVKTIAVVRGESTSVSTATRKNKKVKRKSEERRKIGRRGDWILRAAGNGNKNEFGAGEAGNSWTDKYGTKYLREGGLKLPKTLKDMLLNLMEKISWNKEMRKKIQTVGIIHGGLMMTIVYADNPKGYICRYRRSDLMEVPDVAEKFDSILMILASVLNIKSVVRETIKMIQKNGRTKKSFKNAGFGKRPREEDNRQIPACLSTPKKVKVCANAKRSYPESPCPGSPNAEPLI